MFEINTLLFLTLVTAGALVQTITGFAMGLIIMAGVAVLNIADIGFAAIVVSFISLANTSVALRRTHRHIDLQMLKYVSLGLLPAMVAGIVLLNFLNAHYRSALQMILGIVIIIAGFMLMITPQPYRHRSSSVVGTAWGACGGLIAGLYSAGGAPLAYFMYRQPEELSVIRSTLLSIFAVSTLSRTLMVAVAGKIDIQVLTTAAISVPLVIVVTLIAGKFVHLVPDKLVRKLVFVLLMTMGAFLIFRYY